MRLDRPASARPRGRAAGPAAAATVPWDLYIGAPVYTADGQRLGTLVSRSAGRIVVECGHFLHRRYAFTAADLARYEHGVLHLRVAMVAVEGRRLAP